KAMSSRYLIISILLLFCDCKNQDNNKTGISENSLQIEKIPDSVLISPIYPDSVYFVVEAELGRTTEVKGKIEGFNNISKNIHEIYFQRFVEKQDRFRLIHAVGNSVETIV